MAICSHWGMLRMWIKSCGSSVMTWSLSIKFSRRCWTVIDYEVGWWFAALPCPFSELGATLSDCGRCSRTVVLCQASVNVAQGKDLIETWEWWMSLQATCSRSDHEAAFGITATSSSNATALLLKLKYSHWPFCKLKPWTYYHIVFISMDHSCHIGSYYCKQEVTKVPLSFFEVSM